LEGILDKLRSDRLVDGISLENLPSDSDIQMSNGKNLKLPGHTNSRLENGDRNVRPSVMCLSLQFSPTGHEFAVATTQGLQIFCLDDELLFIPVDLAVEVTPQTIELEISSGNFAKALLMSAQLGDKETIRLSIEAIKLENIELVVGSIGDIKVVKLLLQFIAEELVSFYSFCVNKDLMYFVS
jgi:periodic tryptophan protein 2